MLDTGFVQHAIGYLKVNPLLAVLLGGVTILFLISLLRKLLKLALFLALVLVIGVYYVGQEASAFWENQVGRLESEIGKSGRKAIEQGKEILEGMVEKEMIRQANELKKEVKKKADTLTE